VKEKQKGLLDTKKTPLYKRIREILELARTNISRTVNTTRVVANWLIGREIVEEEQKGEERAEYGHQLLEEISEHLKSEFGAGYSVDNLELFRRFYLVYSDLISDALRRKSFEEANISDALPRKLKKTNIPFGFEIGHTVSNDSWKPGQLHSNLSWTHYRALVRVDKKGARAFYEIESVRNNWTARELERQINSLLYERLALSKDKKGLMSLATKGQEIQKPADVFKDPMVMEFLGLPESPKLVESDLEQALINNLQSFLLELGKGFAFVSRQERITLDGDHFYIDLVFYHTILKCFIIIDLKVGKLNHQDLGQLQLYVNYYDQERRTEGDNPTLGLILCTDKNDAVVRYTLGPDQQKKIFASRYRLYLPTEAELKAELRRELRLLSGHSKGEK
jgi:predicted nuclease of restriction endonuclease-like (RecB) superfamily